MNKAENTRNLIINKAAPIFNIKGIAGTSIEDVVRAAKVARGCLYGHFENKEELASVCVDYLLSSGSLKTDDTLKKGKTAREKIHRFLEFDKNPLQPAVEGGCPVMNMAAEADDTNPLITKKLKKNVDHYLSLFEGILKDGIRSGEFSDSLNPADFAMKMFCAVKGATVISRIKNSAAPMKIVVSDLKRELDLHLAKPGK